MGEFFARYKMIIYVLAGVLVAGGAWYTFTGNSGQQSSLLVSQNLTETDNTVDKDLLHTLLQLRAVSLSGSILSDPSFQSLKDFGTQIVPEPIGRPNPFAPLTASPSAKTTTTTGRTDALFSPRKP